MHRRTKQGSIAAVAATAAFLTSAPVMARRADEKAARIPLEAYIKGHSTGDADVLATAFDPRARVTSMTDSGLVVVPVADFLSRVRAGTKHEPDGKRRTIAMLDIKGTAAIARIDIDLGATRFNDYITMMKFPDGWKIVNKSFHRETTK